MIKNSYKFFYIFVLISLIALTIFNIYNFEINIFGDRDLIRSQNLPKSFEVYGYEFGMQSGKRIPGGFYYYYLGFLDVITNNILVKSYISLILTFFSFIYLFRLNKKTFNNLDLALSLFFLLSSLGFLQQTKIFWNPSLGLPFCIFGIGYFINFFENEKRKNLFISLLLFFLSAQFHISYLSFVLAVIIILLFLKKFEILNYLPIIVLSFVISYLPLLLNLIIPLTNPQFNDYDIIREVSSFKGKDFNILSWFLNYQLYKADLFFSILSNKLLLSKEILKIIFLIIVISIIYFLINFLKSRKFNLFKSYIDQNILIITFLFILLFFVLLNFNFVSIFFILPTFVLITLNIIIFRKTISSKLDSAIFRKLYLLTYIYLIIFFLTNLTYFLTFDNFTNVIDGTNRYSISILIISSVLTGTCTSLIISEVFVLRKKINYVHVSLLSIFIFFQLMNAFYFVYKDIKENKVLTYSFQTEVLNKINQLYDLNERNFLSNVGFVNYTNNNIVPIEKLGLAYYINNNFKKKKLKAFDSCIIALLHKDTLKNNLNIKERLNSFFKNKKDDVLIKSISKFENFYIIEYIDKYETCINNLSNDYILTQTEKDIEKFFLNKNNNQSYLIKDEDLNDNYYFKFYDNDFKLPISFMLKLKKNDNEFNLELTSKVLRNSSSKLNGYWDEIQFYKPKIMFKPAPAATNFSLGI